MLVIVKLNIEERYAFPFHSGMSYVDRKGTRLVSVRMLKSIKH